MIPETRLALVIANYQYQDAGLRQLIAPRQDAEALARVLSDPAVGSFQAKTLLNEPSYKVNQAIEAFFAERKRDDLLLLYFSGHGVKDEDGQLYFATTDTRRSLLRSTAVSSSFVNDVMHRSRSRRQVLLIDCCYSGAFARGMLAKGEAGVGTQERFAGHGRVVLTASDAMQYSFEGDAVAGRGVRSVFTRTLVGGLETGEADLNGDGLISLDELYDYVHDRVVDETPEQRPGKWAFDVQGEIVIARNPRPIVKIAEQKPSVVEEPKPSAVAAEPLVRRRWTYGRVLVLCLLLLGLVGPWTPGCSSSSAPVYGYNVLPLLSVLGLGAQSGTLADIFLFLTPLTLFLLFLVTVISLLSRRARHNRSFVDAERAISGATFLSFWLAFVYFVSTSSPLRFLWGFWTTAISTILAPLNLLGEWLDGRKRRA